MGAARGVRCLCGEWGAVSRDGVFPDTALRKEPLVIGRKYRCAVPQSVLKALLRHYDREMRPMLRTASLSNVRGHRLRVVETTVKAGWSPRLRPSRSAGVEPPSRRRRAASPVCARKRAEHTTPRCLTPRTQNCP